MKNCNVDLNCIWCYIRKNERYSTELDYDILNSLMRTYKSNLESFKKNKGGMKNEPLIKINPENVLICGLHLGLRITDFLLRNLINFTKDKIEEQEMENIINSANKNNTDWEKKIKNLFSECGLKFSINKQRIKNEETLKYVYTNLNMKERKKLMNNITEKLRK